MKDPPPGPARECEAGTACLRGPNANNYTVSLSRARCLGVRAGQHRHPGLWRGRRQLHLRLSPRTPRPFQLVHRHAVEVASPCRDALRRPGVWAGRQPHRVFRCHRGCDPRRTRRPSAPTGLRACRGPERHGRRRRQQRGGDAAAPLQRRGHPEHPGQTHVRAPRRLSHRHVYSRPGSGRPHGRSRGPVQP